MGFMKAMKAANNYWAMVSCDSGVGYLGPENLVDNRAHKLVITIGTNTITFGKTNVKSIDLICATSEWVKYAITLKNDKRYIATFMALSLSENTGKNSGFLKSGTTGTGKKVSIGLLNFECWMSDIIYREKTIQVPTANLITPLGESATVKKDETESVVKNVKDSNESSAEDKAQKESSDSSNKEKTYLFALQMIKTRSYDIAYNAFLKIKGYKNVDELIKEIEDKI